MAHGEPRISVNVWHHFPVDASGQKHASIPLHTFCGRGLKLDQDCSGID